MTLVEHEFILRGRFAAASFIFSLTMEQIFVRAFALSRHLQSTLALR
jgi:hypothetical protein